MGSSGKLLAVCALTILVGCGTTKQRTATEQLLMSDAVDVAVSEIDFRTLTGQEVFLDTRYLKEVKGRGFVDAPYIISSIRQQMTAAGCLLKDDKEDANVIVEARVGALGTNGHEITYGIPQTSGLNTAAQALSNSPALPVLPELSFGRIDSNSGIAKIVVFAYDKASGEPVWQSGIAKAESSSRSAWILGAGPFQKGSVHDGVRFAGSRLSNKHDSEDDPNPAVPYFSEHNFKTPGKKAPRVADLPKVTEPDSEGKK